MDQITTFEGRIRNCRSQEWYKDWWLLPISSLLPQYYWLYHPTALSNCCTGNFPSLHWLNHLWFLSCIQYYQGQAVILLHTIVSRCAYHPNTTAASFWAKYFQKFYFHFELESIESRFWNWQSMLGLMFCTRIKEKSNTSKNLWKELDIEFKIISH